MRWLLLKDLQILRRSPLMVATIVLYPIMLAVVVGVGLNSGPSKPKTAFLNEVPAAKNVVNLGGESVDASKYANQIFKAIDPVPVDNRKEAEEAVRSGRAVAALIVPKDITDKIQNAGNLVSGNGPEVEVIYNAENALKQRAVRSVINSELGRANQALAKNLTQIAANYINLVVTGGDLSLLGQKINILGLENSKNIIDSVIASLPEDDPRRVSLGEVAKFADLAGDNLDVSGPILDSIARPIGVKETILKGKSSSLDSLATPLTITVAMTFVTLLLAAGMLALEREENAFGRLVRGLVSRLGLVIEKVGLAALCSFVVCLLMLMILGVIVDADWGRSPLWIPALIFGAFGFAAMGVAVGCLAREVRSASLLVFALSLPMAALALVPSGAVGDLPYTIIKIVNFVLPFKWALQALDAAINDADPSIGMPLVHLAALTVAFTAIARLALRRFA